MLVTTCSVEGIGDPLKTASSNSFLTCSLRGDRSFLRLQVVTVFGLRIFSRVTVTTWGLRGAPLRYQVVTVFDFAIRNIFLVTTCNFREPSKVASSNSS